MEKLKGKGTALMSKWPRKTIYTSQINAYKQQQHQKVIHDFAKFYNIC